MFDCGSKTETADHFFVRFPFFAINRNGWFKIGLSLRHLKDELLSDIIFNGFDKYKDTVNKKIFLHTIVLSKISSVLQDHCLTTDFTFYYYHHYY